jgi:5'-nucleotidase
MMEETMEGGRAVRKLRAWMWSVAVVSLSLLGACTHGSGGARPQGAVVPSSAPVRVTILAINDFHGQLPPGKRAGDRPAGSAAVLAAYLEAAGADRNGTLVVHAGDLVSASPPASSLLHDEPTVLFMNHFANQHCRPLHRPDLAGDAAGRWDRGDAECNMVATFGNHEFDRGRAELARLLYGGDATSGLAFAKPYPGALFPYVTANVVDKATGLPIAPPYVIREVRGVRIAFVGATVKDTPTMVTAAGIRGLAFLDEADAINRYIPEIERAGVHAIVALIHQGGSQKPYQGETRADSGELSGAIVGIVNRLDPDVDVVISGHTHRFTNAFVANAGGRPVLVTQAYSSGTAFADIDLAISPATDDVVGSSAAIVTTYADAGPGLTPAPWAAALTARAEELVAPLTDRVIGRAAVDLTRAETDAGESGLGDVIADAQRHAMGADVALMNSGGIRADIRAGSVTWGQAYAVQPFGNTLVRLRMTGRQLADLLETQWRSGERPTILQVSGMQYTWSEAAPAGGKLSSVTVGGRPLQEDAVYTVVVNSFLADGGDGFTALARMTDREGGPLDLDAFIDYLKGLPQALEPPAGGRITRVP